MRVHSLAMVVSASVVLFGWDALACRCRPPDPSREGAKARFDDSAAVFRGKVLHVAPFEEGTDERRLLVSFEVSQAWKGPATKRIDVASPRDSAACGIEAQVGQEYLVFAQALPEEEGLPTSLSVQSCGGTSEIAQIEQSRSEWLAFLSGLPELKLASAPRGAGAHEGSGSTAPVDASANPQDGGAVVKSRSQQEPSRGAGSATCSSTGFGFGVLPLLALGTMLRRRRD